MGKSLVIVESDAKSKTINRFLGNEYIVRASVGHIKNLPKNRIGVDVENGFEPEYITIRGRGKTLRELKKLASSSDCVFLATDPDREGEAIASHLAEEISSGNKDKKLHRVLFHEITEKAVHEAIGHPLDIDLDKVEAQKARRVMDRLVGYEVSPFLWKTVFRGLSAGRVQSVALRLICERDREIAAFVPVEYWSIEADFKTMRGDTLHSKLLKFKNEDLVIPDEACVRRHMAGLQILRYHISNISAKEVERNPYPPYITSTLQQDGARRLAMTTKKIMATAQQLYEGVDLPEGRVGLITYMRTDSTRLSGSAVQEVRDYIAKNYGMEYVPSKPRFFKNKKSAQDAHEAIRPTSVARTPKSLATYLTPAQLKLYELIWTRFVACQMSSARMMQTVVDVTGGDYLFRTTGSVLLFRGFMQVYSVDKEEDGNDRIPEGIKEGDAVTLEALDPEQHFTKPPPRYNESSLVKELDNKGIGRPSTYALIISTLLDRKYVEKVNRNLQSTELGFAVNDILVKMFPNIFDVGFTAQMEEELDQIESGEKPRLQVLQDFYTPFKQSITLAMEKKEEIKESLVEERGEKCPKCGKDLVVKWGRNGRFIACTGYPDCRYTQPLEAPEKVNETCPTCGGNLVVKQGRFGRFLACSNYPDCTFTKSFSIGIPCPQEGCTGQIVERKSKRGRVFYGCSNYPACRFASWHRPRAMKCPSCGNRYMEERSTKAKGAYLACPKCKTNAEIKE